MQRVFGSECGALTVRSLFFVEKVEVRTKCDWWLGIPLHAMDRCIELTETLQNICDDASNRRRPHLFCLVVVGRRICICAQVLLSSTAFVFHLQRNSLHREPPLSFPHITPKPCPLTLRPLTKPMPRGP